VDGPAYKAVDIGRLNVQPRIERMHAYFVKSFSSKGNGELSMSVLDGAMSLVKNIFTIAWRITISSIFVRLAVEAVWKPLILQIRCFRQFTVVHRGASPSTTQGS
jgi:hypothetical protein